MTTVEIIKAEIERLKETKGFLPVEQRELTAAYQARGYQEACDDILSIIDSLQEEPVSDNLEEAAIMHYKDVMEYEAKTGLKPAYMTSFKTGAHWQKERMDEDAIDGKLFRAYDNRSFRYKLDIDCDIPTDKYKAGDKVKVIIIKEE